MRPDRSYDLARAIAREGRMSLASVWRCPHPGCGKACVDEEALKRHKEVNHPRFPPPDEMGSE